MTFSANQRVKILDSKLSGVITGFGTSDGEPVAMVRINNPMWVEDRSTFITVIVAHVSNLEEDNAFIH